MNHMSNCEPMAMVHERCAQQCYRMFPLCQLEFKGTLCGFSPVAASDELDATSSTEIALAREILYLMCDSSAANEHWSR